MLGRRKADANLKTEEPAYSASVACIMLELPQGEALRDMGAMSGRRQGRALKQEEGACTTADASPRTQRAPVRNMDRGQHRK